MSYADGTEPITNTADMIDSREVIARIGYLEEVFADPTPNLDLSDEEREELDTLRALATEASDYAPDWEYGETLIRDSYFEEYAQELAADLGLLSSQDWPHSCIDWNHAARELQYDYTAVELDGVRYWIR